MNKPLAIIVLLIASSLIGIFISSRTWRMANPVEQTIDVLSESVGADVFTFTISEGGGYQEVLLEDVNDREPFRSSWIATPNVKIEVHGAQFSVSKDEIRPHLAWREETVRNDDARFASSWLMLSAVMKEHQSARAVIYEMVAGKTYYGRFEQERVNQPPGVETKYRRVLTVSDKPFEKTMEVLTPAYQGRK